MLYVLADLLRTWFGAAGTRGVAEWLQSAAFRTALAGGVAFLFSVLTGPRAIAWLKARFRERIVSDSQRLEELHRPKQGTPTMGGLLVLAGLVVAVALCGDLRNSYVVLGLVVAVALGALGAIDDATKLGGRRRGLSERHKLLGQAAIAAAAGIGLYLLGRGVRFGHSLVLPGLAGSWALGWLLAPWAALVIVASSNGLNLTDGLDGLAGGCFVCAGAAVAVLDFVSGNASLAARLGVPYVPGCGEVAVLLGAAVGATLGFLWFNCHPADVFLGDTGSLALGGLLGYAALVPRQELLLVLAGGVLVAETSSVLVQRYYFKLTRRRVFRCAPLHHHFQFQGWPEEKIVVRFWIVAALLAILTVATLKFR
jgi:phospho-N-acetylmuramoyl-pentapeptide-transferase